MMKSDLWLLHLSREGFTTPFALANGVNVVGRTSEVHICLPDKTVSRWHALIRVTGEGIAIRDLESASGTLIDNHQIQSGPIRPGQRIQFGKMRFLLATDKDMKSKFGFDDETDDPRFPESKDCLTRALSLLSEKQRNVFGLLLQGLEDKKIAANLKLAKSTVHNHKMAIFGKFGVHKHTELLSVVLHLVDHPLLVDNAGGPGSPHFCVTSSPKTTDQLEAIARLAKKKTNE